MLSRTCACACTPSVHSQNGSIITCPRATFSRHSIGGGRQARARVCTHRRTGTVYAQIQRKEEEGSTFFNPPGK